MPVFFSLRFLSAFLMTRFSWFFASRTGEVYSIHPMNLLSGVKLGVQETGWAKVESRNPWADAMIRGFEHLVEYLIDIPEFLLKSFLLGCPWATDRMSAPPGRRQPAGPVFLPEKSLQQRFSFALLA